MSWGKCADLWKVLKQTEQLGSEAAGGLSTQEKLEEVWSVGPAGISAPNACVRGERVRLGAQQSLLDAEYLGSRLWVTVPGLSSEPASQGKGACLPCQRVAARLPGPCFVR